MKELAITLSVVALLGMGTCLMERPTSGPLYGAVVFFALSLIAAAIAWGLSVAIEDGS